ncbi:MAG: flagellar motor protein, partial [Pseudomonadota bacterium]|nr:flagellar motor protein [Pseudomonadota bacterium]
MDKLSFLGLIVAVSAIAFGYALEGGVVSALFNGPALIIVLGGTLGAVMLQTPASVF